MLKPCIVCGVLSGDSRCAEHRRKRNTTARGYGSGWQRKSRKIIAAHPWCAWCGASSDLTVDHIVALSRGGSSEDSNLMVLCRPCHGTKTAKDFRVS
jgi:5-methylcytosine-specific restriction protein A